MIDASAVTLVRIFLWALFPMLAWTLPIQADEVEKILFIIVEDDEVIASNTRLGTFNRLELDAKEDIVEYQAANAVAVVVTNQRFIGYGANTGHWNGIRVRAGETLSSMEVADYSASLVTSDRLLNFYGRTGTWSETRR